MRSIENSFDTGPSEYTVCRRVCRALFSPEISGGVQRLIQRDDSEQEENLKRESGERTGAGSVIQLQECCRFVA